MTSEIKPSKPVFSDHADPRVAAARVSPAAVLALLLGLASATALLHPYLWFTAGVGLLVATLGVSFHDFKLTYQVLLTAWLYATPIIYPIDIVPEEFRHWFMLNPLLYFCSTVRDPIYLGQVASIEHWLLALAFGFGTLLFGWWVFTSRRGTFDYNS